MKEQGVALDSGIWVGFMGPANMPADVLDKVHGAIEATVADARMQDALRKLYVLPEVKAQPAYQAFINGEYDRWGRIIQAAKITLE
jgi:tripartite-type tricarboxylate transporter receptor subunit TctC